MLSVPPPPLLCRRNSVNPSRALLPSLPFFRRCPRVLGETAALPSRALPWGRGRRNRSDGTASRMFLWCMDRRRAFSPRPWLGPGRNIAGEVTIRRASVRVENPWAPRGGLGVHFQERWPCEPYPASWSSVSTASGRICFESSRTAYAALVVGLGISWVISMAVLAVPECASEGALLTAGREGIPGPRPRARPVRGYLPTQPGRALPPFSPALRLCHPSGSRSTLPDSLQAISTSFCFVSSGPWFLLFSLFFPPTIPEARRSASLSFS